MERPKDIEEAIKNAKTVLEEFCLEESINNIIDNAKLECEIATNLYGTQRKSKFFYQVMTFGLYDRLMRARYMCGEFLRQPDNFCGFDNRTKEYTDTRKDKDIIFINVVQWTDKEIETRLKNLYGDPNGYKKKE